MSADCRHVYITSDAVCMHCGEDVSRAVAAAVDRLAAAIEPDQYLIPGFLGTRPGFPTIRYTE